MSAYLSLVAIQIIDRGSLSVKDDTIGENWRERGTAEGLETEKLSALELIRMSEREKSNLYRTYFGFIKGRTSYFRDYILELEQKFNDDLKVLRKKHEKDLEQRSPGTEPAESFEDYYSSEILRIDSIFLRSFRYSAVVGIYSLLETSMNSLCSILKHMKNIITDLNDMEGDGIERARLYLMTVCKIDLPDPDREWLEIQKLKEIRNCVVHAEGNISKVQSPERIMNMIDTTDGLSLENDQLVIEKEYLQSAITWIEDYLRELHERAFFDE